MGGNIHQDIYVNFVDAIKGITIGSILYIKRLHFREILLVFFVRAANVDRELHLLAAILVKDQAQLSIGRKELLHIWIVADAREVD